MGVVPYSWNHTHQMQMGRKCAAVTDPTVNRQGRVKGMFFHDLFILRVFKATHPGVEKL